MSLLDIAKADILAITGNSDDWATALEFAKPDGTNMVTVNGLATSHNLNVGYDGVAVTCRNVHISVAESALLDLGFVTRNAGGDINLRNCKVKWTDATGVEKGYVISEAHPDNTVGLIVCTLKDAA